VGLKEYTKIYKLFVLTKNKKMTKLKDLVDESNRIAKINLENLTWKSNYFPTIPHLIDASEGNRHIHYPSLEDYDDAHWDGNWDNAVRYLENDER